MNIGQKASFWYFGLVKNKPRNKINIIENRDSAAQGFSYSGWHVKTSNELNSRMPMSSSRISNSLELNANSTILLGVLTGAEPISMPSNKTFTVPDVQQLPKSNLAVPNPSRFVLMYPLASSPQVRLKMNDKKLSKFQFYFSRVLEAFSMLKK